MFEFLSSILSCVLQCKPLWMAPYNC